MKKYNVETVYALEGQIFKSYFEEATHATIFRGSIIETVEIESLVKDKVSVTYYYSFIGLLINAFPMPNFFLKNLYK